VFEVTVDDVLVFSKRETGRFPEDGEVVRRIGDRR
jgi:selT/selW/selH-like putative selenoprotein